MGIMKTLAKLFRCILLLVCIHYSRVALSTDIDDIVLVGSTPGDEAFKAALAIPGETKIDFIRWNLILRGGNSFILDIHYGESKPNTLGFIEDGEKKSFQGTYSVSQGSKFDKIFHLKSADLFSELMMARLSENVFQLLSFENRMVVGNGGWSYSLNRRDPVPNNQILITSTITDNESLHLVYEGRTPCQEIDKDHPEINAAPSCFKIKWRLILNKDSLTHQPTTCSIRNIVNNEPRDVSGKWEIITGTETRPGAIVYKILADNLADPIFFLVGDDNVLFFLDNDKEPLVGNQDFSFTMNRRR